MIARTRRAVRRGLRRQEEPARGDQEHGGRQIRHEGLCHVRRHSPVPGRANGCRCRADCHGRPLARAGLDHGDAGGKGRVLREAVVPHHGARPDGGRDGAELRPRLSDRNPAAQRGEPRLRHRDGPYRPPRPDPHGLCRYPLARRDAPRLAAGGTGAAQGRTGLGCLARPLSLAALQPRICERRRVVSLLRFRHRCRHVGGAHGRAGAARPRHVERDVDRVRVRVPRRRR